MGPWALAEAAVKACLSAPARALPGDDNASASVLERALNEMLSMRRRKPLTDEEAALLDAIYYAGYVHLLRERWLWSSGRGSRSGCPDSTLLRSRSRRR